MSENIQRFSNLFINGPLKSFGKRNTTEELFFNLNINDGGLTKIYIKPNLPRYFTRVLRFYVPTYARLVKRRYHNRSVTHQYASKAIKPSNNSTVTCCEFLSQVELLIQFDRSIKEQCFGRVRRVLTIFLMLRQQSNLSGCFIIIVTSNRQNP